MTNRKGPEQSSWQTGSRQAEASRGAKKGGGRGEGRKGKGGYGWGDVYGGGGLDGEMWVWV